MSRSDDQAAGHEFDALRELAPAYALGALDESDRLRFELALERSPALRAEVEAFRVAATSLGASVPPVAPPPSVKSALFARLDETPQERPAVDGTEEDPAELASEHRPAPEPRTAPVDELAARRHRRRLATVLSSAAIFVLLLVAGVVVGTNWVGPNGWGAQREMTALAEAPDAEQSTAEVTGGGEVTLVWSAEQGRSAIVAEGLPDVGGEHTYELWYIDDSGAVSAGTFDVRGDETWRLLEGEFAPGTAVGITIEPTGGSPEPTTEPIAVIAT